MKKNNRTQTDYLKLCASALQEIKKLGPNDGEVFLRLKKKAAKYLEKAKKLSPDSQ